MNKREIVEASERYYIAVPDVLEVLTLSDEDREMYLGWWRSAQAERYGFRIEVVPGDLDLLINGLLQARAEHGGFEDLVLYTTSSAEGAGVVFLAKRNTNTRRNN